MKFWWKFFIKLTNEELVDVLRVFKPVLLKDEILQDEHFTSEIGNFITKMVE